MTYESLSDGGFATGSMLGSGGFIVYDDTSCIVRNTWNFAVSITMKVVGNVHLAGTGWLEKVLWRIENGQGREDIDLFGAFKVKLKETRFVH
jgi:NADH-quinone oxidoreductase subunit F